MTNYDELFSLNGKTALITGGTGGLGSAVALSFLQKGAQVAVCSNHPEKAAPAADYAKKLNRPFLSLACDITCSDSAWSTVPESTVCSPQKATMMKRFRK